MTIQEFLSSVEKMKETLERAFNLGKSMYEEYCIVL